MVHVADFETGALAGEAARTQRREAALVRQFGQRVGLVHELRELRRAEEFFDRRDDGTDVDQRLRRHRLDVLHRHAFAHDALEPKQADTELILQQLSDGTDAPVPEMIDVVFLHHADGHADQAPDNGDHVLAQQAARAVADRVATLDALTPNDSGSNARTNAQHLANSELFVEIVVDGAAVLVADRDDALRLLGFFLIEDVDNRKDFAVFSRRDDGLGLGEACVAVLVD